MFLKKVWRLWAKALGEKATGCNKESDIVALIRTAILFFYFITNIAIILNAWRHWDNITYPVEERSSSTLTFPYNAL